MPSVTRPRGGKAPATTSPDSSSAPSNGGAPENFESMMQIGSETVQGAQTAFRETRQMSVAQVEQIEGTIEKIGQGKQREGVRDRILSSNFVNVKELVSKDEEDIGKALEALQEIADGMDVEFQQLTEPTKEEKRIVDDAKSAVAALETKIVELKNAGWFSRTFGGAESKLETAGQELEASKLKIVEAQTRVQAMIRERLRNANMESSINTYVTISKKTTELMKQSVAMLVEKIKTQDGARNFALTEKEKASQRLKEIDQQLLQKELDLKNLETELEGMVNGSPEYATKDREISDMRVHVKNLRGDKGVALSYFQTKEIGCQEIGLALMALIEHKDTLRARITRIMSETETRTKTYDARLAAMKVMQNQQFDELIGKVGTKLDRDTAEYLARSMVAAGDALMKGFEAQPEKLKQVHEILRTMAEHQQSMRERADVVDSEMRKNNGIDGTETSFFHYEATPATPPETPAAS